MMKSIKLPWPRALEFADALDREGYTTLAQEARKLVWEEAEKQWDKACLVCHDTGLAYDAVEQREVPCGGLGCTVET